MRKKSEAEPPLRSPIAFRPCSNGEMLPRPETARDRRAERRFLEIVEEKHRRLGMTRREFAQSSCGVAAALLVMNEVYGCGGGGGDPDAGRPGADGGRPDGGRADGGGADAGGLDAGRDSGFEVPPDAAEDAGRACEVLEGDDFVFDVQVHTPSPLAPWRDGAPLPMDAETFVRTVFVDSETTVACLSGIPGARAGGADNVAARAQLDGIVERLAGPRLRFHANVDPTRGPSELDYMADVAERFEVAAWKVYPHVGRWRLDDEERGMPFVAQAAALGVPLIAAHRGIAADPGGWDDPSSPADLAAAAAASPGVRFLCYHSGWQTSVDEDHPFDPDDPAPRGVDRLIKGVLDHGIGNDGNVYAELGSTWRNLMTSPSEAAHVLGKLLLYLGEDRVVWGTDSVFTGSPQEQIVALRTFTISEAFQERYGYPALTDAIRAKVFGLNAASVYGVDPERTRCVIADDFVDRLAMARRADPRAVPVNPHKDYGPRTRRELLAYLRWERHLDGAG